MSIWNTFAPALPEMALAVMSMALLMLGVFFRNRASDIVNTLALLALAATAVLVLLGGRHGAALAFGGVFVVDSLARIMKLLVLFATALAIIMSVGFMKAERIERFEYPVLMLLSALGMMMMVSANGLIALYLGLELQSLALYVLAAMNRDSVRSSEAGLKYFVLGALASGLILYGASLVYGFAGATSFSGIAQALKGGANIGVITGIVFILAGLAFKISAVPFHMWTPDVYEGAPTPVTAFFAAAPKLAAMALLMRVLYEAFPGAADAWRQVIVFMAIASALLGAFAGLAQRNIKRLLAYSSIGHMGVALVGLAAGGPEGLRATMLYLVIYLLLTVGAFAVVIAMRRDDRALEEIEDFAGLASTNPGMAFTLAAMMFALAGIPPLAGFFAKYFAFVAALKANLVILAIIVVLASVISAYYYLRVVKVIYMDEAKGAVAEMPFELKLISALSVIFALGFVFWPQPVMQLAQAAIRSLL